MSRRHLFCPHEHEPRTKDHLEDSARKSEETGNAVFGVKGKSVLTSHIDVTESVPVDYMHAVLEGVTICACLLYACCSRRCHKMFAFQLS